MVLLTRNSSKQKNQNTCTSRLWLCVVSGVVCALLAVLLQVTDLIFIIGHMQMAITNGSGVHEFLSKPMRGGVQISVYLFNITNADRFLDGTDRELAVQELGPFTYRETRVNEDLELDPDHGVVRYSPRVQLEFMPEESIARPEDVNVTMISLPMLGMSSQLSAYPYWTRVGFNMLARQINSKPIVKIDAHKYMWGYKDPLLTLGHTLFPGLFKFEKIGIMDRFYDDKKMNRLEVGATLADTLMIKKRNGHRKLEMAEEENPDDCETCDSFENSYEGIIYPGPVTSETRIRLFRSGLCRLIDTQYYGMTRMEYGADGVIFNISDSFFSSNKTAKGLLDLSTCYYGLPISLSKGHFLGVDPKVYDRVKGMKPDPAKHNSYIIVEPKLGIELDTHVAIQLNAVLGDLQHSAEARAFSDMVIPFSYMLIVQPPLQQETMDILKSVYVVFPPLIKTTAVLLAVLALLLFSYSVLLLLRILSHKEELWDIQTENMAVVSVQEPLVKTVI